jgi:hypothetical protein
MMSSYLKPAGLLLLLSLAACWDDSRDPLTPTPRVLSSSIAVNGSVSATFSQPMDPDTLTTATFTLTSGTAAVPVQGTVSYANQTVVFRPAAQLASQATFTATITAEARSASGVALAADYTWSITTGDIVTP